MVWLREAAGWVMLGTGLAAFAVCYFVFLLPGRILEALGLGLIGITVFRAGMHLLKIAMAASASREVEAPPSLPQAPRALTMPGTHPGRAPASVVPGRAGRP